MTEGNAYLDPDFARFYDWMWAGYEADLPFYTYLAGQHGGPVLEVACGTGRVVLPLARAGHAVLGLDSSPHMLQMARAKLAKEPPDVRGRVELAETDMTEFDLRREFSLVLLVHGSVFHMLGRYSLTRCLKGLYRHTRPGGLCVVDCPSPTQMAEQQVGAETLVKEGVNPATGLPTKEFNRKVHIDWSAQTVRVEHRFVEGEGRSKRECRFEQDYRWLRKEEGVEVLEWAGFPEVHALGDFAGGAFTPQSPRLILTAHRLERDVR